MSTYEQLRGARLKFLDQDPANANNGQVWYNSTTGKDRVQGIGSGAFISTSPYLTPNSYLAGFGTTTAGVTTGGDGPPGNGITTTGEYNGTGWSTGGALGTGRRGLGAGTNSSETAGLVFGGADPGVPTQYANVEEYNGSTWSEVTNLPGNQANVGGFGTQTAGACLPNSATATLEYDGTNWTSGGSLSNPRSATLGIGCGTQTAGLAVGGSPAAPLAGDTEEYDGTSWTAGGDYPRAIQFQGSSGIQTSALISGGGPSSNTDSGTYDGTAFSTGSTMATGREAHAGVGSAGSSTGLAVTGRTAPRTNAVEEFNFSTTTITAAAWASGGALPTALRGLGGFGTQTAAISAGGLPPGSGTTSAFSYDGSTWTGIPAIGAANSFMTGSRLSPGSAGSVYGGEPVSSTHQYWDGSSWSEQTDMNSPRYAGGGAGTQTSSLMMGGIPGAPGNTATEEWDGSAWTNQNDAPHGIYNSPGSGSQTAALIFGGNNPTVNTTAEYDGTNWTTSGTMITSRASMGGGGTQTDTIIFGGATSPPTTATSESEGYDGTSWSTRPSLGTARRALGSAGHTPTALAFGGTTGSDSTATEEFTGETTSPAPAQSLTTSS